MAHVFIRILLCKVVISDVPVSETDCILSYMAYFTRLYLNLNLYCDNGYFSSSNSEFWLKKRISNLFIYHAITNTHIHFCMPTYTFKLFNVASFLLVTVKYSPPTISLLMKLFCSQAQNIFTFPKFKNIDISIRWCYIFNLVRHLNAKIYLLHMQLKD